MILFKIFYYSEDRQPQLHYINVLFNLDQTRNKQQTFHKNKTEFNFKFEKKYYPKERRYHFHLRKKPVNLL